MKYLLAILFCSVTSVCAAQKTGSKISTPDPTMKITVVEAACGQCKFALSGKGCSLAIRKDGKAYFVDGTKIDEYGDAHADDGFCQAIRQAEVQGEVIGDRYQLTYFKLLPVKE